MHEERVDEMKRAGSLVSYKYLFESMSKFEIIQYRSFAVFETYTKTNLTLGLPQWRSTGAYDCCV